MLMGNFIPDSGGATNEIRAIYTGIDRQCGLRSGE